MADDREAETQAKDKQPERIRCPLCDREFSTSFALGLHSLHCHRDQSDEEMRR